MQVPIAIRSIWATLEKLLPWLFGTALVLSFVQYGRLDNLYHPDWVSVVTTFCNRASNYLCYLCLLLMLHRHPWYVITSVFVLWVFREVWGYCGLGTLFASAILVVAARDYSWRKILWIFFLAILSYFLFANIGYWCGFLGDITKHRYGLAGHSWGTCNPNMWAALLMILMMLVLLLLRVNRISTISIVCCLTATIVFFVTLSLTTALALLALPLVFVFLSRFQINRFWFASLPWTCLAGSLILMFYFGPSLGETTFDSRFSMGCLAFERYGVSWMGQNCGHIDIGRAMELGVEAFCVDNMYLRLLLYFGLIPMTLVLTFFSFLLYRIAQSQDIMLMSIAICFLFIAFMEAYPVFATMNFTLFYSFARQSLPQVRDNRE